MPARVSEDGGKRSLMSLVLASAIGTVRGRGLAAGRDRAVGSIGSTGAWLLALALEKAIQSVQVPSNRVR